MPGTPAEKSHLRCALLPAPRACHSPDEARMSAVIRLFELPLTCVRHSASGGLANRKDRYRFPDIPRRRRPRARSPPPSTPVQRGPGGRRSWRWAAAGRPRSGPRPDGPAGTRRATCPPGRVLLTHPPCQDAARAAFDQVQQPRRMAGGEVGDPGGERRGPSRARAQVGGRVPSDCGDVGEPLWVVHERGAAAKDLARHRPPRHA
jgi:hypothetical protein